MAAIATTDALTVTLTSESQEPGAREAASGGELHPERRAATEWEEPGGRRRSQSEGWVQLQRYSHTGDKVFRCFQPRCTKAFVSKYKLLRHMATHSPQKNHRCSVCEKMFHRKDHLKNHLQTHDPNKESFRCGDCGKLYHTKLGYRRHAAMHSATSGDLTCKVCLQGCESTAALLEHLRAHSGKPAATGGLRERRHPCVHCDRRFYTRKDVRRHLVVHTGRKDFLCPLCAQCFGRKDHLTRHAKKSHPQEQLGAKAEPPEPTPSAGRVKEELDQLACSGASRAKCFAGGFPVGLYDPHLQPAHPSQACLPGVDCPHGPLPLRLSHHHHHHAHPLQQQQQHPPMAAPPLPKYQSGSTSYVKMEMDSFLMDLQSGLPVPTLGEPRDPEGPCGDALLPKGAAEPVCAGSADFFHLLGFLPLGSPSYSGPVGSGLVMGYAGSTPAAPAPPASQAAEGLVAPPPAISAPPQEALPPLPLGFSPTPSATTLPRFHQAFQ
ncbi:zinc finger protein PLAGL2-like [Scleropages formosus]|uniref:Zinc finger protein PLAGL2-like n=1 Tax=Scleropages formosus TaxID=113540 RepID=A0A0P7YER0_SCLFO|nr:zinc finger protein PLAGL2-like [Scleropages formosus]